MVDWDTWEPGIVNAAKTVRSIGVAGLTQVARVIGVPIDDLSPSQQESVARDLADALEAGQAVDWLDRHVRECLDDRERSHAVANTLLAWAMTHEALVTYRANGLEQWEFETADDPCPDCKAIASNNPHSLEDLSAAPPIHSNCRCCVLPVISGLSVDESRE